MDSHFSSSTKPLYRGVQAVWYVLGIIEVLLAFRLIFKLLGANPGAGFSKFIYGITYVFSTPFLSVFKKTQVVTGSVFEWGTILAMIVYWIIAVGIIKLFIVGKSVSTSQAADKLENEENK